MRRDRACALGDANLMPKSLLTTRNSHSFAFSLPSRQHHHTDCISFQISWRKTIDLLILSVNIITDFIQPINPTRFHYTIVQSNQPKSSKQPSDTRADNEDNFSQLANSSCPITINTSNRYRHEPANGEGSNWTRAEISMRPSSARR